MVEVRVGINPRKTIVIEKMTKWLLMQGEKKLSEKNSFVLGRSFIETNEVLASVSFLDFWNKSFLSVNQIIVFRFVVDSICQGKTNSAYV